MKSATPVMQQDSHLPFEFPAVARKKVSIAFDEPPELQRKANAN
jgi:hypothetical protein